MEVGATIEIYRDPTGIPEGLAKTCMKKIMTSRTTMMKRMITM
jgi:hypothetical protein